jgi:hypothetical protein
MPPRIKVLEAAGAIGDGRVKLGEKAGDTLLVAQVRSSDGSRTYRVALKRVDSRIHAYSDDNGTRYRGYVGYPIIALMMLANLLPRNPRVENALKGIPWKALNEKFKKYSLVEEHIRSMISDKISWSEVESFRSDVLKKLSRMGIYYDPSLLEGP